MHLHRTNPSDVEPEDVCGPMRVNNSQQIALQNVATTRAKSTVEQVEQTLG
jgi:hypothetical protein